MTALTTADLRRIVSDVNPVFERVYQWLTLSKVRYWPKKIALRGFGLHIVKE